MTKEEAEDVFFDEIDELLEEKTFYEGAISILLESIEAITIKINQKIALLLELKLEKKK